MSARAKPRLLLVDDESTNRELLESMLNEEGYILVGAESGQAALDLVACQPPDLILLDVLMPVMDGFEVTEALKGNAATRNIPIILVTAVDDRAGRLHGLSAGAEDFLAKPVDRAELCSRVRNLLRLKSAIEDARAARLVAEAANTAQTLFLRAMSHELRTPLQAIIGYAELLEMGIRGQINTPQRTDLGRILRAGGYLQRLINDLLTVARLEGARPLHPVGIAVAPMLAEVEGLCTLQAQAKSLTLTVARPREELVVTADAERIQQILINLITNAIKFTGQNGSVDVACEEEGGLVLFHVADTGIGISHADIDRIFEPFVQVPNLTTPSQQGVGLGLAISRDLARAMQGDLTVQSSEGTGSTFTLALPICVTPLPRAQGPAAPSPTGSAYQLS